MQEANIKITTISDAGTLPQVLVDNYEKYKNRISMRKKKYGIWNEYTWEHCYNNIKSLALGLKGLGMERGDKVCIIGDNDPQWFWAELAAQSMGGIVIGMYIDATSSEIEYLVNHSESKFAVAKDQEQVDKFLDIQDRLPGLRKVIYWDDEGMWAYKDNSLIISYADVIEMGNDYEKSNPYFFKKSVSMGQRDDIAVLCYTSGTTGLPKGAMISYDYLFNAIRASNILTPVYDTDDYLSFLTPAWIAEQCGGIAGWLINRAIVDFPEEPETVQENLKEISPQYVGFGPRQWQSFFLMTQKKINDAGRLKKLLYDICMPIGYKIADFGLVQRRKPPLFWKILYLIADWICFRPIKDYFGIRRLRVGSTGGAALGPDIFHWFRALGVELKEGYGLTETLIAAGHGDVVKVGTAGPPGPDGQVRISADGEILLANDRVFRGYYKQPEETARTIKNGWVHTGDAGVIDEDGHVIILDRVKDMLKLRGGGKYSPTYIENRLKFSSYIKDAMAVGGEDKDFLFAIISIDFDNVGRWTERKRIPYTTFVDLSQKTEVADLVLRDVQRVNKTLPEGAKIHKYVLLPKEFDPDEGELTRTRKIRRAFIAEKYSHLINAAYTNIEKVTAETEVKYRDGRTGKTATNIFIRSAD